MPPTLTASGNRMRCVMAWAALASSVVLGACAYAPGMQMDASTAALIRAKADLFTIDASTVRQMIEERRAQAAAEAALDGKPQAPYEYLVAPQDLLRITVWNHPELTNPSGTKDELVGRVINADGRFFFPYVGDVKAAGRSVTAIRDDIVTGLRRVIKTPQVDVSVMQYRGQRVLVAGEVRTPGTQAITDVPPDLTEILARAGGATAEADLANVTITRNQVTTRVDLVALYYRGDMRSNLRLRHGDVVNVPERREAKVFVTGEVIRPTPLLLPRGRMSLADALAEAGGVNPLAANAGQIFVIRGAPAEARSQIYHLDASSPSALLLADRFDLNARDVVYVDTAPVVRWNRVISNVLPSAVVARDVANDTTKAFPR